MMTMTQCLNFAETTLLCTWVNNFKTIIPAWLQPLSEELAGPPVREKEKR